MCHYCKTQMLKKFYYRSIFFQSFGNGSNRSIVKGLLVPFLFVLISAFFSGEKNKGVYVCVHARVCVYFSFCPKNSTQKTKNSILIF